MNRMGAVIVAEPSPRAAAPADRRTRASFARPGWPLTALLVFFPLWWVLGLSALMPFLLAVPMAAHLLRRRPVFVPPGFGLWVLFLIWVVTSMVMLGYDPPGTLPAPVTGRLVSVAFNLAGYLSATIVLLYAINLTEEEFPRRRLVRQLGALFVTVVAGGLLGILAPRFEFTSPVEMLLPDRVARDVFVQSLVHPAASQVQDVLGFATPRPSAPFGFTNMWGYALALLVGWFVVGYLRGSLARKLVGIAILAAAAVPIVFSLNRGLWLGLALAAVIAVVRAAARGNLAAVAGVVLGVVAAGVLVLGTPLTGLVQGRLDNGHSNDIRTFTTVRTIDAVGYSPLIGLGSTRAAMGSANSIAVGQESNCPRCGNPTLGSNGQLWAILIAHGVGGALLFVGFFVRSLWAYRRDRTPIGDAGVLAILLSLYFMFVYNALPMPLIIAFLSIALLWRNKRAQEDAESRLEEPPVDLSVRSVRGGARLRPGLAR